MAQAIPADTRSAFITQLLAPVSTPRERRRLLAELRDETERAWRLVHHRFWAARAYREHTAHLRAAAEIERRSLNVPEAAENARAHLAMIGAIDQMMKLPAPTIGALRHKQKLREVDGGRDWWEVAIAADKIRLLGKK